MKRKGYLISLTTALVMIAMVILSCINRSNAAENRTFTDSNGITWRMSYDSTNRAVLSMYVNGGTYGETLTVPTTVPASSTLTKYVIGASYDNILNGVSDNTIKNLIIPDTVTEVKSYALLNLNALESVTVGSGVSSIGFLRNAPNLKSVTFTGDNPKFQIDESGVIYSADGTKLVGCIKGAELNNYVVKPTCTSIEYNGLTGAKINGITFPEGLTTVNMDAFSGATIEGTFNVPSSVTTWNSYALENATFNGDIVLPDTMETIPSYMFASSTINGTITFPSSLKTIESSAFYNVKFNQEISLPDGLISIGSGAFSYSTLPGTIVIPNTVTNIGSSAFSDCKKLTGVQLSSNLQTIGSSAFYNCDSLSGVLNFDNNVTTIESDVFNKASFDKVFIGDSVTSINASAFQNCSDLWIDNTEDNVTINGNRSFYVHWAGDTHNVLISSLPGVKLINVDTNQEIITGDYDCLTTFNFRIEVEDGYDYSDLQIFTIDDNNDDTLRVLNLNDDDTYSFDELIRDRKVYVRNMVHTNDVSLRTFVSEINNRALSQEETREPSVKFEDGDFRYEHTKYPVSVKNGDLVKLKVRVYNEGIEDYTAAKIAVTIPDGLTVDLNDNCNIANGWSLVDGKYVSSYLADKSVGKYNGTDDVKYRDLEIVVKVTAENGEEALTQTIYAEVEELADGDGDSEAGNADTSNKTSYKEDVIYDSNATSYIAGQEDDDDFETIKLNAEIRVTYDIKVNKVDGANDELLEGAEFNLCDVDGTVLATSTTNENGELDFGTRTTYGEGIDVYYVKEVETPSGYYLPEGKTIKIEVEKKILDEAAGTYSVTVRCDTIAYTVDTSKLDFIPVKDAAQLRKIGSGDVVTIDGKEYTYSATANYKLEADIDLSGVNWTPIAYEISGVFDGNGHKISNLTIAYTEAPMSEVGLFSVYSGIVENLELENVSISVDAYAETPDNISGKTGVGAFAGVMKEGFIVDCKVSGTIDADVSNIGGFVGHTLENGIVRINRFENYAEITGNGNVSDNIGGAVGCSLGSISVNNSTNMGGIHNGHINVGGLVGYVDPSQYQDTTVTGAYEEDSRRLDFYVQNTEVTGEYTITLETINKVTEALIPGAKYTVYDRNKDVIDGLNNITLETGSLKILEKDIITTGYDTYYIKENETVGNYNKLVGVARLDVERYWDSSIKEFRVRATVSLISDDEYSDDEASEEDTGSRTGNTFEEGEVFTEANIAKANWRTEKAEFINCVNTAELEGFQAVAGIVGTSHGYTYIDGCSNIANISATGFGQVSGIIAELHTWKNGDYSKVVDCSNTGDITDRGSYSTAAGIVAQNVADLKVEGCTNEGAIINIGSSANAIAGGIVGSSIGILKVDSCENSGEITASENKSIVGGVVGRIQGYCSNDAYPEIERTNYNIIANNELTITDTINTGDINSGNKVGGLIGTVEGIKLEVRNCQNKGTEDKKVQIKGGKQNYSDKGGIVATTIGTKNIIIDNCEVDYTQIDENGTNTPGVEIGVGGMIGEVWYDSNDSNEFDVTINNCEFTNSEMPVSEKSTYGKAGMIGSFYANSYYAPDKSKIRVNIFNCSVKASSFDNSGARTSFAAGMAGSVMGIGIFTIDNCTVEDNTVIKACAPGNTDNGGVAGMVAMADQGDTVNIKNCTVKNSTIDLGYDAEIGNRGSDNDCGGIAGQVREYKTCNIENCKVYSTNILTSGANVGGIIGADVTGYLNIIGCDVKDSHIVEYSGEISDRGVGGILGAYITPGYANGGIKIEDCTVDNTNIDNLTALTYNVESNHGGIAGLIYNPRAFDVNNCTVKDSKIRNSINSNGRAAGCIGGITGYVITNSEAPASTYTNCTVINTEIDGSYQGGKVDNAGGIIACESNSNGHILDNCKVINCTIKSNGSGTGGGGTAAGLVAVGTSGGGQYTIKNCKVSGCEIEGLDQTANIGGLGAVISIDKVTNTEVSDCHLTMNSEKTGNYAYTSCGAAFGAVLNDSGHRAIIDNVRVTEVDIETNAESVGGIIGYTDSDSIVSNSGVKKLSIVNTGVKSDGKKYEGSHGGIVGNIANRIELVKDTVDECDITINSGRIGGLIGIVGGTKSNVSYRADVDECKVLDSTFINKNIEADVVAKIYINGENQSFYAGEMAGLVALANCDVNIGKSSVSDCTITTNDGYNTDKHAGGLVGYAKKVNISNSKVEGETTITHNAGIAGGVVGVAEEGSVIDGIEASGLTVTSKNITAGVAGIFKGNVSNVEISGSTVTSSATDVLGEAAGIIAILEGTLEDSTVDNITVSSTNGDVGGAVGVANNLVKGVSVTNSSITSPRIAGGVVGAGFSGETRLVNLTIDGNTVTSAGIRGDYIGSPDIQVETENP